MKVNEAIKNLEYLLGVYSVFDKKYWQLKSTQLTLDKHYYDKFFYKKTIIEHDLLTFKQYISELRVPAYEKDKFEKSKDSIIGYYEALILLEILSKEPS